MFQDSDRDRDPTQWPDRNRYVEGVFKRLCHIHQQSKTTQGSKFTCWNLILSDYTQIRDCVLSNFRVMSATSIQLYQVNMTTLTQRPNNLVKQTETVVLQQTDLQKPLLTASEQLPPLCGQVAVPPAPPAAPPLRFDLPENTAGMVGNVRPSPRSATPGPGSYMLLMPKTQLVSVACRIFFSTWSVQCQHCMLVNVHRNHSCYLVQLM